MVFVLFALMMADFGLTYYLLTAQLGTEGNPIMAETSFTWMGLAKTMGTITVTYIAVRSRRTRLIFIVALVLMALVVAWNATWMVLLG